VLDGSSEYVSRRASRRNPGTRAVNLAVSFVADVFNRNARALAR
jgi:hypothetical protein